MVQGEICSKVLAIHGEQIGALSQTLLMSTWHPPIQESFKQPIWGLDSDRILQLLIREIVLGVFRVSGRGSPREGIYNIPIPMAPFQREPEKMRDFPARILINVVF
jgi:hypothetical protein